MARSVALSLSLDTTIGNPSVARLPRRWLRSRVRTPHQARTCREKNGTGPSRRICEARPPQPGQHRPTGALRASRISLSRMAICGAEALIRIRPPSAGGLVDICGGAVSRRRRDDDPARSMCRPESRQAPILSPTRAGTSLPIRRLRGRLSRPPRTKPSATRNLPRSRLDCTTSLFPLTPSGSATLRLAALEKSRSRN